MRASPIYFIWRRKCGTHMNLGHSGIFSKFRSCRFPDLPGIQSLTDKAFQRSLEASGGKCRNGGSYNKPLFILGKDRKVKAADLNVKRLRDKEGTKTSAPLPPLVFPRSPFTLPVRLQILQEYFLAGKKGISAICEKYNISDGTLYNWITLLKQNEKEWSDLLTPFVQSYSAFLSSLEHRIAPDEGQADSMAESVSPLAYSLCPGCGS